MESNHTTVAESAIKLLKDGIANSNKSKILEAYAIVEHESFSWDDLDVLFMEWDELTEEANDILYS